MPEVTERILERGLNKRTGESEGSNEGYGERFFNRSIGSRVRVRNRAEKIKFDRISGSSLMPLLPLLLCVNRTLGTISGDCRAALAMTGKTALRCGDGMGLLLSWLFVIARNEVTKQSLR